MRELVLNDGDYSMPKLTFSQKMEGAYDDGIKFIGDLTYEVGELFAQLTKTITEIFHSVLETLYPKNS